MQSQTTPQEIITFKVDSGLKEYIKELADAELRSVSGFIKNAVREYIIKNIETTKFTPQIKKSIKKSEKDFEKGRYENLDINDISTLFK